jgi:shikimate kinase
LQGTVSEIITIEREYGCGGGDIARRVANHLEWTLWDQALTNRIAELAEVEPAVVEQREERRDPMYYRFFKAFLRGSYEGSLNVHRLRLLDTEAIMRLTQRVVLEAAASGHSVIVGRGSQHFLRDRPGALRIFLYAPKEEKVRRLTARGKPQPEAEELVETVDRERAAFIREHFHLEWPNRCLYHAMINTAVGDDTVVRIILGLATVVAE